ncbi:hypothetical protein ABQ013_22310, partial [Xanthomonas citri pv. malvacearum]
PTPKSKVALSTSCFCIAYTLLESQRLPNRSASSVGRINAIAVQRIGERSLKALISVSIRPSSPIQFRACSS